MNRTGVNPTVEDTVKKFLGLAGVGIPEDRFSSRVVSSVPSAFRAAGQRLGSDRANLATEAKERNRHEDVDYPPAT